MANSKVDQILEDRGVDYGEFMDNAWLAQGLKDIIRQADSWDNMDADKRQAFDVIMDKTSRLLTGDSSHLDSWLDIQGYAKLVSDRLERGDE